MLRPAHNHPGYWAFLALRLSGVALTLFLPVHLLMLGLTLEEAADGSSSSPAGLPLGEAATWSLVALLALHLALGLRVLALELLPWCHARRRWVGIGAGAALGAAILLAALAV